MLLEIKVAKDDDSLKNFVYQETKDISFCMILTFYWHLWGKTRMFIQLLHNAWLFQIFLLFNISTNCCRNGVVSYNVKKTEKFWSTGC